ncbi:MULTISPECIES: hypothetical protein [unclassified Acidovorax]|uniref:hypothetical protein n=1 Tax=unclassified Acidovorax TaxID=2684926 RepID=UPI001C4548FA|nr:MULTISPECIES: hypothetical protein [unclassified Acidovorax]MBV7428069.1 hypothetical protein [Acidovorax sp. sif0732]MBV7449326.1 hypothetical protein [Acidovorax sp. sif0715]
MNSPTWQELCDAGRVLIDQPDRGLAIYPTTHGNVVVGVRSGDGALHLLAIQLSEMDAVANALAESEVRADEAKSLLQWQESAVAAYHAIERVRGTG